MPQITHSEPAVRALDEIRDATRRYQRSALTPDKRQAAREALNAAIVRAVQAGVRQAQIARTSGLSKAQVSRVARGGTSGATPLPPAERLIDLLPADEVIERYRSGESVRALEEVFGCSRHTLYGVLKSHGVPRDKRPGPRPVALPTDEIVTRSERGESAREIGRVYGVSYMTVLRRIREHKGGATRSADSLPVSDATGPVEGRV